MFRKNRALDSALDTQGSVTDLVNQNVPIADPRRQISTAGACAAGNYFARADLVKSGFDGEHTESNHRLMYT